MQSEIIAIIEIKVKGLVGLLALFYYITGTLAFAVPENYHFIRKGDYKVVSDKRRSSSVKVILGQYVCKKNVMGTGVFSGAGVDAFRTA